MPEAQEVDGELVDEDRLERYRAKRTFDQTPEPSGAEAGDEGPGLRFVVQKHDARRLHYDFRLEAAGVLISWAVPKGPSYDPKTKRLAVHVEDHPLDYRGFEGVIPGAQYGSGTVIVWDEGTYRNLTQRQGRPVDIVAAVEQGHVSVWLDGTKLRGGWSLTRTGGNGAKESWIMVKRADERADPELDIETAEPDSVRTGRSLADLAAAPEAEAEPEAEKQWTRERATWRPPMLAQLVKPAEHLRNAGGGWRYERKLDGLRCVAVRNGDQVELWSRNHLSFNGRFPSDHPVFCAFDLLSLLGQDTTGLPLTDRQALLAQALEGAGPVLTAVQEVEGDPADLLARACADGWEGLIAKRVDAVYKSGRSPDWRKLKCSASQELVIGGWTDPTGTRVGFGALLVGYYDGAGALHYAGKVGTGFDDKLLRELSGQLAPRARPDAPFVDAVKVKGVHWVEPELVGAVSFSEWTTDGRLRHPSFQGLRPDKAAREVRREAEA
jgi:bifunctional non-homologous end joining protein LigD